MAKRIIKDYDKDRHYVFYFQRENPLAERFLVNFSVIHFGVPYRNL